MATPDSHFTHLVGEAFKQSASVLALSRSPLATGALIAPGLVLDDLSPTPDERGLALRLALQWATEQIAPEPAPFPFGVERPLDDATWRDPRWWRYNLLRHRYLEPIHPDEFVEGGRYTETLLALTGIPTADLLFDERARAVREAAQWLQRQQTEGIGSERLRALALTAVLEPLRDQRAAVDVLAMAAVLPTLFRRDALLALAIEEGVGHAERAIETLLARRCLLAGDGGASLWLSPVLRAYIVARQPRERLTRRHQSAAALAQREGRTIEAAQHWLEGNQPRRAADLILALPGAARAETAADLIPLLRALAQPHAARALLPGQARALALLLADLLRQSSQQEEATAACREALRTSESPVEQGEVYRRLGKLYEEQNQQQALTYYQMAVERLPADHPEIPALLKDRAWVYLLRREWAAAEADLLRALDWQPLSAPASSAAAESEALAVRADILDGLASLHRGQGDNARAVEYARAALGLREQLGDPTRLGKSFINLGILYRMMGDYDHAIGAYREAQAIFQRVENQVLVATALLNIGTAFHFAEQLAEAEAYYRRCLALADEVGLPLTEVRAHANLVEALADQGRDDEALGHWRAGYALSVESGFDEEVAYLRELLARYPALETQVGASAATAAQPMEDAPPAPPPSRIAPQVAMDADEAAAMAEVARAGRINAAAFMRAAHISKATATRKLVRLATAGLLERHGSGRGTWYTASGGGSAPHQSPVEPAALQARLAALQARYSTSHAVERFEVRGVFRAVASESAEPSDSSATAPSRIVAPDVRFDVRVVFRRLPDVTAFFDLEAALSDSTRTRINLVL